VPPPPVTFDKLVDPDGVQLGDHGSKDDLDGTPFTVNTGP
jgi:hypothetical protein